MSIPIDNKFRVLKAEVGTFDNIISDMENVAKKDEENTFTELNNFQRTLRVPEIRNNGELTSKFRIINTEGIVLTEWDNFSGNLTNNYDINLLTGRVFKINNVDIMTNVPKTNLANTFTQNNTFTGNINVNGNIQANGITRTLNFSNTNSIRDPLSTDNIVSGYTRGSYWVNTTTDKIFFHVDEFSGSAVWREMIDETSTQTLANKNFTSRINVNNTQVIGTQQSAISDLLTTATNSEIATKINSILSMLRTHGLIAT